MGGLRDQSGARVRPHVRDLEHHRPDLDDDRRHAPILRGLVDRLDEGLGAGHQVAGEGRACSIPSAVPSTTPPMAIVYSSGYVKVWDMFRVGIVSDLQRLAALILIGPFLAGLIL